MMEKKPIESDVYDDEDLETMKKKREKIPKINSTFVIRYLTCWDKKKLV